MADHTTLLAAFNTLRDEVAGEFVRRDTEIDMLLHGLVSAHNVFILSEPGTGKSAIVRRLVDRIDGCQFFSTTMSRHTVPDDVFGPQSISALLKDELKRKVDGFAPTAHVAFLDELWKTGEATANGLLELLNERTFNQDGVKVRAPLHTAIAASNEVPQDEHDGLGAAWDRLMIRGKAAPLSDRADLLALWDVDFQPVTPVLTWDQVLEAHTQSLDVKVPDDIAGAAYELKRAVNALGVTVSNRRFRECKRIIQAAAWLDGVDTATVEHLEPLGWVFWDDPDQIDAVEREVALWVAPNMERALEISDGIAELIDEIERLAKAPRDQQENGAVGLLSKVGKFGVEATDLLAVSGGRVARLLGDSVARLQSMYETNGEMLLGFPTPMPFDVYLDRARARS